MQFFNCILTHTLVIHSKESYLKVMPLRFRFQSTPEIPFLRNCDLDSHCSQNTLFGDALKRQGTNTETFRCSFPSGVKFRVKEFFSFASTEEGMYPDAF